MVGTVRFATQVTTAQKLDVQLLSGFPRQVGNADAATRCKRCSATSRCRRHAAVTLSQQEPAARPATVIVQKQVKISSSFDAGNINVAEQPVVKDAQVEVGLEIVPEPFCETDSRAHFQWYYFRASGVRSKSCKFRVKNAGDASYEPGWQGYNSTASYDRQHWFRVPTTYDEETGELCIEHTPEKDVCYYAYFAPYSLERHADLVSWAVTEGNATATELGMTLDGYPLDLIVAGSGPTPIWIIARQHPGESMAEWWMEGLIKRLLDSNDPLSASLLQKATFFMVPNVNPDGSRRGHLRTNAAGRNLNREWAKPSEEASPEVYHILKAMSSTGCDLFLDVHGDEALPYNFIAGGEGIPCWGPHLQDLQDRFKSAYMRDSPDFQVVHGYPEDEPGQANLTIGSNAVGEKFQCLSMTLEQPFKDTADTPRPEQGWCPERAMKFGESVLGAINEVIGDLRK
uniref:Peptidase M14 domain-containing protein n=1 Tax=Pyramimonas obovata TaxID=1411642 RepID=A0A7S0R6R8_9CHLO